MEKIIDLVIITAIRSSEFDEYRNNKGILLIKAIFGALRVFWPVAYDSCKSGDDFNVPILRDTFGALDVNQFSTKQIEFLNLFCERVAHHLGYYCEDFSD